MNSERNRFPNVRSLASLLPKGSESGREFARVVDLLLFHDARHRGSKFTAINDAAGDYHGLDSFEGDSFRVSGTLGYQYKFYSSPLNSGQRSSIDKSFLKAVKNQERLRLTKWILITPDDFIESSARQFGGDVTWFEGLRARHSVDFEIEHWGHTQLINLFLQAPSICLFYYPELIQNGVNRRKTIHETRHCYDDNISTTFDKIEFVGMSVYKDEAARGVPMEHIYIPLSLRPEGVQGEKLAARDNPMLLLLPGERYVFLGHPGTGKSTLLRVLARVGTSTALQKRCKAQPDDRLPIFVSLRRYAEQLKHRENLGLLDYLIETTQADYSLPSADLDFFQYWLDSGRAILLFDGLDELPSSHAKLLVRDRIRAFVTTYPSNTTVVTSRIVGYNEPFCFSRSEFRHYELAQLLPEEIEQFIKDWYNIRVGNARDRNANIADLSRILRDPTNTAIRELAENPLLLTIIALVHRIDAVLPDQRVVLYQKCTETLLNTWHKWKQRDGAERITGKEERRNRRRMEVLAHWFQRRDNESGKVRQAVAPHAEVRLHLAAHIRDNEKLLDGNSDPDDLAEEFLDFVRRRAGLLVEVGDGLFSFVHLTFQEYLCASHLITESEVGGIERTWSMLAKECEDPRWHEVMRLLVAGLKSDAAQEFLIEELLTFPESIGDAGSLERTVLLGGLLLDGIEPAAARKNMIVDRLITAVRMSSSETAVRRLMDVVRASRAAGIIDSDLFTSRLQKVRCGNVSLQPSLIAIASGDPMVAVFNGGLLNGLPIRTQALAEVILDIRARDEAFDGCKADMEKLWNVTDSLAITSPGGTYFGAIVAAMSATISSEQVANRRWKQLLSYLLADFSGPFSYFVAYLHSLGGYQLPKGSARREPSKTKAFLDKLGAALRSGDSGVRTGGPKEPTTVGFAEILNMSVDASKEDFRNVTEMVTEERARPSLARAEVQRAIVGAICRIMRLRPVALWREAIRTAFLPTIGARLAEAYSPQCVARTVEYLGRAASTEALYSASALILLDVWYILYQGVPPEKAPAWTIVERTATAEFPPLALSHSIYVLALDLPGSETGLQEMVNKSGQIRDLVGRLRQIRRLNTHSQTGLLVSRLKSDAL